MGHHDIPFLRQKLLEMLQLALLKVQRLGKAVHLAVPYNPLEFLQEGCAEDVPLVRVSVHLVDGPGGFPCSAGSINHGNVRNVRQGCRSNKIIIWHKKPPLILFREHRFCLSIINRNTARHLVNPHIRLPTRCS